MKKISLFITLILFVIVSCKEANNEKMETSINAEVETDTISVDSEASEEVIVGGGKKVAAMNFSFSDLPEKLKNTYRANNSIQVKISDVPNTNILRIEEKIPVKWKGVRSCGEQDRINRNVKKAIEAWVSKKMFENSDKSLLRWGAPSANVNISSSKAPWPDNSRSCRGSVTLSCFVEFYIP